MQIGGYHFQPCLALAPMAGVTDLPFRHLCRRQGANLLVGEMLTSDSRLWHARKSKQRLPHRDEPGPITIQIAGGDAQMMAEAARRNVDLGAQIIDINMGCPAKKVCRRQAGSALLENEPLVAEILHAVVSAVSVPVTLKYRTGPDPTQRNAVRIAQLAASLGIQALTLHGRTRACRFHGDAEYQTIADVVKSVSIPVVANGDIDSPEKARKVLASTGASGIMIGRAAQGNPWIFRDLIAWLETGCLAPPLGVAEVRDTVLWHLDALHAFYGLETGVRIARKHLGWYCANLPGGESFRCLFNRLDEGAAQQRAVTEFFHNLDAVTDHLRPGRYGQVSFADGRGETQNGAQAA